MAEMGDLYVATDRPGQVEWKIKGFLDLPKTIPCHLKSPHFRFYDTDWYLSFYPNGANEKDMYTGMAIYLSKESSPTALRISFTIGIKKFDGSVWKFFGRTINFKATRDGWGRTQLYWLHHVEDILGPDGTLWKYCSLHLEKEDSPLLQVKDFQEVLTELEKNLSSANFRKDDHKENITKLKEELELANKEKDAYKRKIAELKEKLVMESKHTDEDKRNITESKEKLAMGNYEKVERKKERTSEKEKCSLTNKKWETGIVNTKEIEQVIRQGASKIPQNLQQIAPNRGECDLKIIFRDKEYMVHGSVLAAKSEVLRRMLFKEDGERNGKDSLSIKHGDTALFEDFLLFIYTGELDTASLNNVTALYRIADHYKVEDLKKACARSLGCNMSMEFMIDVQREIFFRGLAKISNTERNFLVSDNE